MAILVTQGRAALAAALIARPLHIAWGRGQPWWNTSQSLVATFGGTPQVVALPHAPVSDLVVTSQDETITYATPADYTFDAASGVVSRAPGSTIASGGTVRIAYTAGRPEPSSAATALVSEIARRVANTAVFVVPDAGGALETPGGQRWTVSQAPTRQVFIRVAFQFSEASAETIREVGIFVDTVRAAGVPADQPYLLPADVAQPGHLFLLDRFAPIVRSPAQEQGFTHVITI